MQVRIFANLFVRVGVGVRVSGRRVGKGYDEILHPREALRKGSQFGDRGSGVTIPTKGLVLKVGRNRGVVSNEVISEELRGQKRRKFYHFGRGLRAEGRRDDETVISVTEIPNRAGAGSCATGHNFKARNFGQLVSQGRVRKQRRVGGRAGRVLIVTD